jgi:hypothetical protein
MDHTFFAPLDSALHQNEMSTHHFLAVALKYFLTGLLFDDRGNSAASSKTAGWGARIRTWEWRNQNPCETSNVYNGISEIWSLLPTFSPLKSQGFSECQNGICRLERCPLQIFSGNCEA